MEALATGMGPWSHPGGRHWYSTPAGKTEATVMRTGRAVLEPLLVLCFPGTVIPSSTSSTRVGTTLPVILRRDTASLKPRQRRCIRAWTAALQSARVY